MIKKNWIDLTILTVALLVVAFILFNVFRTRNEIDAFSGATPPALEKEVPDGLSLTIDGKVKQTYHFTSHSFRLLAKARIRTREVSPNGEILGAYIYSGIPVLYIMEGIVPKKEAAAAFDRPLDMVVVFYSLSGESAMFSYGELTTIDDSLPILLAYHRQPVLPSKNPENYKGNKYHENISGLRLICPHEPDTSRYLDNVVRMTLIELPTPDKLLPPQIKNKKCSSSAIECIEENNKRPASFENIPLVEISNWFRIGHGTGIKGDHLYNAVGYPIVSFLEQNFPGCNAQDFFVFVGCDGYRSIFSGSEIFRAAVGNSFLLLKTLDESVPEGGLTIAAADDFFVDRCVRGVTHIVRIRTGVKKD